MPFDAALLAVVVTTLAFLRLAHRFLGALAEEAPDVFAELGSPRLGQVLWSDRLLLPFSTMILTGAYRQRLAGHPRSLAWASWLRAVHWLQLLAVVWWVVAALWR